MRPVGGAPNADDALSMALSRLTRVKIQWIYLISDLVVLGLSATYIPWRRLLYSLLTVVLSGQIIGWIQRAQFSQRCVVQKENSVMEGSFSPDDSVPQDLPTNVHKVNCHLL